MAKRKSGTTKKQTAAARPKRAASTVKWVLVVGIAAAALLGAYLFASASQRAGAQQANVAVTTVYTPSTVELKAGAPADITFSRGQGCTSIVKSQSLGFKEDLSSGPRTVHLDALQPGTYDFECGMNMVRGSIVVR